MIKSVFILFIILGFSANSQSQTFLYKGQIDKMPVTLFMTAEENGCGGDPFLAGIYKYDKVSNWLQVNITKNDKEQYSLVEFGFTGLLILNKEGKSLTGIWISPDGKRQLPVSLKESATTSEQRKTYQDKLDDVHYQNHDC